MDPQYVIMKTSKLAENLKGSEIIKLATEVKALQKEGNQIYNLTIGDFNSEIFPIPERLQELIIKAYNEHKTNYPAGNGELSLRESVSFYLKKWDNLDYSPEEILISGGARPVIYSFYKTVVDPGETVLFPVPSWNNNNYVYLTGCNPLLIHTRPENKFMPTAEEIEPHIKEVAMIALCSPLNPTGTTFEKEELEKISDLIVQENKRRKDLGVKPLYLLYDQIYWQLTYEGTNHYNPIQLRPELRDCTVSIDGISKAFSATGLRVGWAFGPKEIISKMNGLMSHLGAWAPKPEQVATGEYLLKEADVNSYLDFKREELAYRLNGFYEGFKKLKSEGFPVDAIRPEAALYLTVRFDLKGMKTAEGKVLENVDDVTKYLLNEAKTALVPFYAFGAERESPWFRLSVGTVRKEEIQKILNSVKEALSKLN